VLRITEQSKHVLLAIPFMAFKRFENRFSSKASCFVNLVSISLVFRVKDTVAMDRVSA
jgi:hypothetical protein